VVPVALAGARLDLAAATLFDLPRAAVRRLCEQHRLLLDGKRGKKGDPVRLDAVLTLVGGAAWFVPDARSATVLFECADYLIVDKPAGVACHPLVPGEGGTVIDGLITRFPELADASPDAREGGLVHRLDTDTSGCLCIARTKKAHQALRDAFDHGQVTKTYLALVRGRLDAPLVIEDAIDHDATDARKMTVGAGKSARTRVEPIAVASTTTLVRVWPDWGRRHQVRIHLASRDFPLVGDVLYGATEAAGALPGHALHALSLGLPGATEVTAPVPSAFAELARLLGCPVPAR
jgi:23S rRNA pseudouridine1911/1915/1917 synthase